MLRESSLAIVSNSHVAGSVADELSLAGLTSRESSEDDTSTAPGRSSKEGRKLYARMVREINSKSSDVPAEVTSAWARGVKKHNIFAMFAKHKGDQRLELCVQTNKVVVHHIVPTSSHTLPPTNSMTHMPLEFQAACMALRGRG